MKFVRILSLLLAFVIAPFMVASAPSDIEQAYKTEKANVVKKVKEQKTKFQEAKKKRAEKAKIKEAEEKTTHRIADIKKLEPVTVVIGNEFIVKQPASPNFGHTWKLHKTVPHQVEMIGEAKFVPADHPGRNEGTILFTFKGIKPGVTQIELEKVYPPELRDKKTLKIRIVPVTIKESDSK